MVRGGPDHEGGGRYGQEQIGTTGACTFAVQGMGGIQGTGEDRGSRSDRGLRLAAVVGSEAREHLSESSASNPNPKLEP